MTALYQKRPCSNCPFRRDVEPGEFTRERYEALRSTIGRPGREVMLGGPMFSCHKAPEGDEFACAGWLATCGHYHLSVRVLVALGKIDHRMLMPQEDWPDLFDSYDEMVEAMAR